MRPYSKIHQELGIIRDADLTPAQLTSDKNDYNPKHLSRATTLRLSSDAIRNITGLDGGDGNRILYVRNIGNYNIVLKNNSTKSSASNRFKFTGDYTLAPNGLCALQYDSTLFRWGVLGGSVGSGAGASADLVKSVTSVSDTYTVLTTDDVIECDGTFTVTLFTSVGNTGRTVEIRNIGTGVITIDPYSTQTINDEDTLIIANQWDSPKLYANGTNWGII